MSKAPRNETSQPDSLGGPSLISSRSLLQWHSTVRGTRGFSNGGSSVSLSDRSLLEPATTEPDDNTLAVPCLRVDATIDETGI